MEEHVYSILAIKEYQTEKEVPHCSTYKGTDNKSTYTHNNKHTNKKRETGPWVPALRTGMILFYMHIVHMFIIIGSSKNYKTHHTRECRNSLFSICVVRQQHMKDDDSIPE